jgi:GTPase SAR1 family protein
VESILLDLKDLEDVRPYLDKRLKLKTIVNMTDKEMGIWSWFWSYYNIDIMKEENYDYIVKLMLVGNSNVGKTAFMHRFCQGTYNPKLPSTIGLDYQEKILISNGIKYMVQLWDTAGQ